MKCKTVLQSNTGEWYTVSIRKVKEHVIVAIHPPKGTAGTWRYRLETLLGLDVNTPRPLSDKLYLDFGQDWYVTGMVELLKEIVNQCTIN